jgi:uncharacterized damage-inducible protein DinB
MKTPLQAHEFVLELLDRNERLLCALPAGAYETPVEALGGAVGGHMRHSLEHLRILLHGRLTGEVYFERRNRDAGISTRLDAGLAELRSLRTELQAAAQEPGFLGAPLNARTSLSGALDESVAYSSCVGRELVYVGLHFVHHMALIEAALRLQNVPVEAHFGKAPATLAYERGQAR